ncbi:MAG: class I adenylate-forming enzyme family protein [Candidatus Micrarchaeota archaeon]
MNTINSLLENSAQKFPTKTAIVFNERKFSYAEINEQSNRVRNFLASKLKKGECVSLLLGSSPEFLYSYFGALKAGATCNPINLRVSDESLHYQIKYTAPRFLIISSALKAKCTRAELPSEVEVLTCEEILNSNSPEARVSISPEDYSTIMYTSGTTSSPKGVLLKHKNVCSATRNIIEYLKLDESYLCVNALALSHSFGLGNVHVLFAAGGSVLQEENAINVKGILEDINTSKATLLTAVPATLKQMHELYPALLSSCTSLKKIVTNTGLVPEETVRAIVKLLPNTNFITYYGLTEASRSSFHCFNQNLSRWNSVGKPAPNVKIKIMHADGKEAKANERGEVCIFGEHVIDSYWKNEEASKAIRAGWFHTGDLGFFDANGFLFISGRVDDVINVGGEKVVPGEVERIIRVLPFVKDAAVVGKIDDAFGEIPVAFIVTDSKNAQTETLIKQECKNSLEPFKIPQQIFFIDEIPKTESGKKKYNLLREKLKGR